uniref:SH3 domain-containing protein n=1 Tax=Ciona savignyi TaxID=51511 RepID=H2ZLM6_CIOSA
MQKFQFDCIGENLTDNEKGIAGSLKEFGLMLEEVATDWSSTIERSELQLIKPLEDFRKEHIHGYRNAKKSFDKASERYYKQLEHTLGLSHKKKGQHLQESDNELHAHKKIFHKEALNYVYKLQEVQERKKFEFVEHLLMFMQVYFNFFHQSHETANDCKDYMKDLQMRLVSTREQYEGAREKTKTLMRKMSDHPEAAEDSAGSGMRWFTSKWTKYFCMYTKENKLFQMLTPYHQPTSAISLNQSTSSSFVEPMIVKTCTRRVTDSIDKRFCFDLEVESGKRSLLTFQAVSDLDRRKWMSVMDGREPEYIPTKFKLDENGFRVIEKVIAEIERRGVEHEGIYRLVGVLSKVDFLLQQAVNPATCDSVDFSNESEWEINTLTSALKSAFRNLPEPILTFELHRDFINAAKPKSAFIPSAFLVEETENLNHQEAPSEPTVPNSQSTEEDESTSPGKTPTSPGKTPTTPSFLWGANDGPTSRPRSSAVVKSRGSRSPTEEVTPTVARTLFSCAGEHPEELSFQPGMLIREVERTEEPGWLRGMLNGKVGLVPENYIEFI